jgi:hypothetical protein
VTELHTSWVDTLPEEAVIEARVEADQEAARTEQVNDVVSKILDALRSNGCQPAVRIEDVDSTAQNDNHGDHLRTSLTDDEHQAFAARL